MLRLLIALAAVAAARADFPAPTHTVDLDVAPEQRWDSIVADVIDTHGWDDSFGEAIDYLHTLIPDEVYDLLEPLLEDIASMFGEEYEGEIRSVYNAMVAAGHGDEVRFGDLIGMNLIYELTVACTSVVAQPSPESAECPGVLHGRNLDYGIPGLVNLTANIDFTSGGEVQYRGVSFVGYVGLLTAVRPGVFSVSIDQRERVNGTTMEEMVVGYIRNVASALDGGLTIGCLIRNSVAQQESYDSALDYLADTRLIARAYLIVGGAESEGYQGAVITRNRAGPDESAGEGVWKIEEGDAESGWWRLETNYDHWLAPPASDDRRDPGNAMMAALGQANTTLPALYEVMSTAPILNAHTQYTATMCPSTGALTTTVR